MSRGWIKFTVIVGSILVILLLYYFLFLNHTSVNEIGIAYNSYDGTISTQMQPGWYVTSPFTRVAYISTLPMRVEVPSAARVIVAKMVRFKPEGLDDFIRLQGFSYYENIASIFLGYAFSGNEYTFLEVVQATNQENTSGLLPLYKDEKKAPGNP